MRIHVTANGKHTSISVDETLIDYLGARMVQDRPKLHTNAQRQQEIAKEYIRDVILQQPDLPTKNVSQYVQRTIISVIAAGELESIIEARGPRYESGPVDLASLFGGDAQAAAKAVEQAKSKLTPLASPLQKA